MTFEITSKYDEGQTVRLNNGYEATILSVRMTLNDNYYRIDYLCEYENQERRWTDETAIAEVIETEEETTDTEEETEGE